MSVLLVLLFTAPWVVGIVWVLAHGGLRALRDGEAFVPYAESARRRLDVRS